MSSYCTQEDIINLEIRKDELMDLTDDEGLNDVDAARVSAAIERASAEIDKHLVERYADSIPFSPVPDIVKGWCATLAVFYAHRSQRVSDAIIDRYNKVMSNLKAIQEGSSQIPGVSQSTSTGSLPGSTIPSNAVQTFTRTQRDSEGNLIGDLGSMEGW